MIERMNGPQDRSRNLLLVGERPSTHPLALDWIPNRGPRFLLKRIEPARRHLEKWVEKTQRDPKRSLWSRCGEFPEVNLRIFRVGVISNLSLLPNYRTYRVSYPLP